MYFQTKIINAMPNKEWFVPLTKKEFETPVLGNDNVYFMRDGEDIAGMCVATCDAPEVLKEYKLGNDDMMLIDSIMVDGKYRGKGLQREMLRFLEKRARKLGKDGLVAAVHPDNIYSLRNFVTCGYDIVNTLYIHGGARKILCRKIMR